MDIGTATPSQDQLEQTPHHLINTLDPDETYCAGEFVEQCENIAQNIMQQGRTPLIVGGTAMYIRCLAKGMFQEPAQVSQTKGQFYREHMGTPVGELYQQLQKHDPVYASQITHGDRQKIIRGLHVSQSVGVPFSEAQKIFQKQPRFQYKILVVSPNREQLYANINTRVKFMMQNGWIDEVHKLIEMGYSPENAKGFQAIGYGDIYSYLRGNNPINIDLLTENIATKTRRFAKRQLTWFRNSDLQTTHINPADK